jgi:RNA polymerase sigma-70 factor, ECF subfamily
VSISVAPSLLLPHRAEALIESTVQAAQRGDSAAFASLYDAHAPRVYALCLGLSGDRAVAAELVQDVFVRVWEKLDSYHGDAAFATWLHRVAVNVALESDRKGRRRSLRVQIAADLRLLPGGDTPPAPDAATTADDPGLAVDLERAIARLPAGARAVFVLHDVEGYQHAEIATRLGIAEGTSKAHLFRARRLLRGMLEP